MALPSSLGCYIFTHLLLPFFCQDMLERTLTYHEDNMIKKKDFRIFMDVILAESLESMDNMIQDATLFHTHQNNTRGATVLLWLC